MSTAFQWLFNTKVRDGFCFFVHERETYHQGTLSNECFDFWTNRFMLQFDNVIESTSFIDCLWVVAALIDIDGN